MLALAVCDGAWPGDCLAAVAVGLLSQTGGAAVR